MGGGHERAAGGRPRRDQPFHRHPRSQHGGDCSYGAGVGGSSRRRVRGKQDGSHSPHCSGAMRLRLSLPCTAHTAGTESAKIWGHRCPGWHWAHAVNGDNRGGPQAYLGGTQAAALRGAGAPPVRCEVVIVDDASTDGTPTPTARPQLSRPKYFSLAAVESLRDSGMQRLILRPNPTCLGTPTEVATFTDPATLPQASFTGLTPPVAMLGQLAGPRFVARPPALATPASPRMASSPRFGRTLLNTCAAAAAGGPAELPPLPEPREARPWNLGAQKLFLGPKN